MSVEVSLYLSKANSPTFDLSVKNENNSMSLPGSLLLKSLISGNLLQLKAYAIKLPKFIEVECIFMQREVLSL